jgi:WD40-like Beta Propeller Repeat
MNAGRRSRWPSRLLIAAVSAVALSGAAGCREQTGSTASHPAGRFLAYSKGVDGSWPTIWLVRADGTHAHRLAANGIEPAVSPDGRWVAFLGCDGALCLRLVSTAGGKSRLLARNSGPARWSPRSDRIVALRGDALAAFDLAGHTTVLVPKFSGEWSISPDGRLVVYTRPRPHSRCATELVIVGIDGRDRHVIARGRDFRPVWGPQAIAFSRYPRGCLLTRRIWRIAPDGTGARPVTPPLPERFRRLFYYGFDAVAWAPDGRALLGGIASEDGVAAVRFDVVTRRFHRLRGYAVDLSHDARYALVREGGSEAPQTILAIPFLGNGHARVLARGDICCPSWNG